MSAVDQVSLRVGAAGDADTRFRDVAWFEWTKFVTLRTNVVLAAIVGVVFPLFAVIVAGTESLQPDDTVLGASVLGGAVLAQMIAAALGALLVSGEIHSGMMRTTLIACPRPLQVLTAKSLVAAGIVLTAVVPTVLMAFAIGMAMLDDTYAQGDWFPAVIGIGLAIASMAVLGVAVGTLVRQPAAAVLVGVAIVLVPMIVAPMLGDAQRWIGGASLGGVMQKLTQSSDATDEAVGTLGAWPSLLVVAAYTTAAVGIAVCVLRRRDS